jgi:hypothetical protein
VGATALSTITPSTAVASSAGLTEKSRSEGGAEKAASASTILSTPFAFSAPRSTGSEMRELPVLDSRIESVRSIASAASLGVAVSSAAARASRAAATSTSARSRVSSIVESRSEAMSGERVPTHLATPRTTAATITAKARSPAAPRIAIEVAREGSNTRPSTGTTSDSTSSAAAP